MFSFLLVIIYISFISLGLPDSLIGSAWPVMQSDLQVPLSYAGLLSMLISGETIISSFFSGKVLRRFGTGLVNAVSVAMTAVALLGFSFSRHFWGLCLWTIPFGLGAGAVDAALNGYVAEHYSSRQMSWLHACWCIGVTISPAIMSACLTHQLGWHAGFGAVGVLQCILVVVLFLSLRLWKKTEAGEERKEKVLSTTEILKIKGVPFALLAFFAYCAVESTAGMWATTYLAEYRGVDVERAASFAALFYFGETVGRILSGFIADHFGDKKMVRYGLIIMVVGIAAVLVPLEADGMTLVGLVVIGFGAAPVYPCMMHATPSRFGVENSQSVVGMQMSCAYVGSTFIPPLFGLAAQYISIGLYPVFTAAFLILLIVSVRGLNRNVRI